MSGERRRDRRQTGQRFRGRPRSSPASLVILTVAGVLLATAAASVLFGGRHSDATPHGRLLGTLQTVAEAQESLHRATGRFTWREQVLDVDSPEGVELLLLQGDETRWEARARAPEHDLSCSQGGHWRGSKPVREEPVCYVEAR